MTSRYAQNGQSKETLALFRKMQESENPLEANEFTDVSKTWYVTLASVQVLEA